MDDPHLSLPDLIYWMERERNNHSRGTENPNNGIEITTIIFLDREKKDMER